MKPTAAGRARPYVIVLAIALYLLYEAFQIRSEGEGRLGADFWPKAILLLAIITCVWQIVVTLYSRSPAHESASAAAVPADVPEEPVGVGRFAPLVGIALTVSYALAFAKLGYFLATFLYASAFIYFGSYRRLPVALCTALVASSAFMFIFMKVVYVSLPIGVEPFAHVSTLVMSLMGVR